jgi:peroxiredoxin Q/BCP
MILEADTAAPDFSLPDDTGKLRSLSEFLGRPVVLFFYPKDDTPG